jgi:hypothetical protein
MIRVVESKQKDIRRWSMSSATWFFELGHILVLNDFKQFKKSPEVTIVQFPLIFIKKQNFQKQG